MRIALVGMCVLWSCGCDILGPSCLSRQKRGTVAALAGEVAAGQVVVHVVSYGTEGSQNDVNITWPGQGAPNGPRLSVYATKVGCQDFTPPSGPGPCVSIGSRGGYRPSDQDFVQTSLIITNGRGNPDILGTPAEYKLWIVGDPAHPSTYSISTTYFYGPDC